MCDPKKPADTKKEDDKKKIKKQMNKVRRSIFPWMI